MNSIPTITRNLIIANIFVFILQFMINAQMGEGYAEFLGALWPWQSGNLKIWQLVTHMFMHGGIGHIFFNMLALFMFGPMLESLWGPKRYFQFYMICGLVAGGAQLLLSTGMAPAVGASGAIMGILAAFAYINPEANLYLMFFPVPIKAKWAIPGIIAIDLFSGVSGASDGIAHFAHLGGAFAGLGLAYFWRRSSGRRY